MARPLASGKQSVDLASPTPRVSKIRRDPPPPVKEIEVRDPKERERMTVVVGVLAFTLALVIILIGFASWSGWSPRDYTLEV